MFRCTTQMREVRFDRCVCATATGDREAFAHLIDATRTLVSSIAFAIARDFDLSREIAQDVFLTAWRDLGKLRNPVSFLPWLRHASLQQTSTYLNATLRGLHESMRNLDQSRPACKPLADKAARGFRPVRKQAPARHGKSFLH
jgi:hypothetical protein